jgi:hypothetical protein
LPANATHAAGRLAHAVFGRPSAWFTALVGLRDAIVAPLGLKTAGGMRRTLDSRADVIDFFPVLERSDLELILGEEDRHLDFLASVLVQQAPTGDEHALVVTTVVHCHNRFGRTYLALILPFHGLIIRSNLRRASQRGWPQG